MAVNKSRYKHNLEWDGPRAQQQRKALFISAETWRKRYYILFVIALAVTTILAGLSIFFGLKAYEGGDEASVSTTNEVTTDDWQTLSDDEVDVSFKYPPSWKKAEKDKTSSLDILNVEVKSPDDPETSATIKLDVIKNNDSLSLVDWVKKFGAKGIKTNDTKLDNESALLATFLNSETGEAQSVYYVSKNGLIYVFDLYQDSSDETLAKQLSEVITTVDFLGVDSEADAEVETAEEPETLQASRLVVNTIPEKYTDIFSSYVADGSGKTEVFSDKEEDVYLKGTAEILDGSANVLVGFFGASSGTSKDGVYKATLSSGSLEKIASGTTGLVRTSRDGKVIGYLKGERAKATEIILIDAAGTEIATIEAAKAIQYFALGDDGKTIAYTEVSSGSVVFVDQAGEEIDEVSISDDNILALDFTQGASEKEFNVAFVDDAGTTLSAKSELRYVAGAADVKQLTQDNFVQDAPRISKDGKSIAYLSHASGVPSQASVWVIGIDGKGDTSVVKTANNQIIGWFIP